MLTGKPPERLLSPSGEHYLRAIWDVRVERGYARLVDVARVLGVAPPTLSQGLKPLVARGLVRHDDARFLLLSPEGERIAREVHHRHAVLLRFLADVLGVEPGVAEREACLIEHDISAGTTGRLVDLLKLLDEDAAFGSQFRTRLAAFHRSCEPSGACNACGLACLTDPVRPTP